jgi:hypothetical protein
MWAAERSSIERARLDGSAARGAASPVSPTSPAATPRQARHTRGRSDAAEEGSPAVIGIFRSLTVGRGRRRERS